MIILDTPSKSIQVYLGQTATNQLNWVTSYVDLHQPAYAPQTNQGNTNDTTAVTIISAPSLNAQRQVKYMSIYNADIGSQLVTVVLSQSGVNQILVSVNVPTGNTLVYHTERGWELFPYNTINFPITVPQGGTGSTSFSPYALIAAGVTSQSPFQQVWPLGNSYQVLTSQGPNALPVWSSISTGTPSGAAGGDLAGNYPNPTVYQAHLTSQAVPTAPSAGTLILRSFIQQGFDVPHIYDSQGNAIEITRDSITVARNNSGVTINKGQVVYITGATGTVPTVALAQANSSTTMPAVGIMYENTNNNSFGRIMLFGNVENINLSAFSNGDELYVSTSSAGGLTKTRPSSPNFPQFIGTVLNNGVGNGVLFTSISESSPLTYGDTAGGDLTGTYPSPTIKSSVNLSGNPTTTTQTLGDNSTKIATDAYVDTSLDVEVNMYSFLGSSILVQSSKIMNITTSQALSNQNAIFQAVFINRSITITGVKWYQSVQGSYTANNYNGVGLYSYSAGNITLVASSVNNGNIWKASTNTFSSQAFSATYAAVRGVYFVAALYCESGQVTAPSIGAGTNMFSGSTSTGDFTNSAKLSSFLAAQTSLASPLAMSGNSALSQNYWFALY